jgi:hypothetical protein
VRKLIKIALVALGIRAFLRWRKRRKAEAELAVTPPPDPADELRQKLAESRVDDATEVATAPQTAVEDRRADVHEQGRAALDEMTSADEA